MDGNKRLAWSGLRAFCLLNGPDLRYDVDQAAAVILAVAAGDHDFTELAAWVAAHLVDA